MRLDLRVVRAGIRAASAPPGLRVICRLELVPEEFLQQGLHRRVAELAVDPQSPEHLHVAHRKEGARAQIREELSPGDLLPHGTCASCSSRAVFRVIIHCWRASAFMSRWYVIQDVAPSITSPSPGQAVPYGFFVDATSIFERT